MAKKTPAINSSSTADIAFLLLCYFLMTTTMGAQTGLSRRLPPMPDKNQKQENQEVNRKNILQVKINSKNQILAGNETNVSLNRLEDIVNSFLTVKADKEAKVLKDGTTEQVSKGVISLQNDRGTSYKTYIEVQNTLVRAINKIRDDYSTKKFGKKFSELKTKEEQDLVKEAVPQLISEAEPKDVGKKR